MGIFSKIFDRLRNRSLEGDKVVWVILFLLVIISVLTIFSSTPILAELDKTTRIDIIKEHLFIVGLGFLLIFCLYSIKKIAIFRIFSQLGYGVSMLLLLLLDLKVKIPGVVEAQYINYAWRTLSIGGAFQLHVFEVVKVAMVMYLAWALNDYKRDQRGEKALRLANILSQNPRLSFLARPVWKRIFYFYIPFMSVCGCVMVGSNSSMIIIALVMAATLLIGGIPMKELIAVGAAALAAIMLLFGTISLAGGDPPFRLDTLTGRFGLTTDMSVLANARNAQERRDILDNIEQPVAVKIAVHEGGIFGKGIGGSTQKYKVTSIYSDYVYSFIIEEYGLFGGILVLLLYASLLARGSMIARLCESDFAKIAVGGLTILITGQAFLHMLVNVDIGPTTGQTLPMISHGSSAFLMFSIAFGIILSISRMADTKIREMEREVDEKYYGRDDIQASLDITEELS